MVDPMSTFLIQQVHSRPCNGNRLAVKYVDPLSTFYTLHPYCVPACMLAPEAGFSPCFHGQGTYRKKLKVIVLNIMLYIFNIVIMSLTNVVQHRQQAFANIVQKCAKWAHQANHADPRCLTYTNNFAAQMLSLNLPNMIVLLTWI